MCIRDRAIDRLSTDRKSFVIHLTPPVLHKLHTTYYILHTTYFINYSHNTGRSRVFEDTDNNDFRLLTQTQRQQRIDVQCYSLVFVGVIKYCTA